MSVIIRLQNLPWAANAADIRQYFQGLSIPEGGVHIVGGEKGDAFISFSTDEDARQAMLSDGGCIKEVQIRLLLSSRNEMQKVIETARQQTMQLTQVYMQQMQQPQLPIVGSLPPLTAKVLPQPQQIPARTDRLVSLLRRHEPTMDATAVLMSQEKQQQQPQQNFSPKSLENKDRDDKSNKRERTRSKSRDRRSKSSRSGGGGGGGGSSRRDRSRSRDRRRRDRSRGRDRSRDRHRSSGGNSRGIGGKLQRSRSPGFRGTDVSGGCKMVGDQQIPMRPWSCTYDDNMQQQVVTDNHQHNMVGAPMNSGGSGPMSASGPGPMNASGPGPMNAGGHGPMNAGGSGPMYSQFRTPPQPPIIHPSLNQNIYQQQRPQKPVNNEWGPAEQGGDENRQHQQQLPYIPDNFQDNDYGPGNDSDDEDDRQIEYKNNMQHRGYNNNGPPSMRRGGPPGQDFHDQRGYGRGPRFHKPPHHSGPGGPQQQNRGHRPPFENFGGGGPRFNNPQARFSGNNGGSGDHHSNISDVGRQSRFSSINEGGKPSRFNATPQQYNRDESGNVGLERDCSFENSKKLPPRYNNRYKYDIRNTQAPANQLGGLCVEVNNMANHFSYGDIRKLFDGIHIDGSAIKIQKHLQGVAFVQFDSNQNKNLAMQLNGTEYKGNQIVIKHLDDEAYERENTDDRPYPSAVVVDHVDLVDDDDDNNGTEQPTVAVTKTSTVDGSKNKQSKAMSADDHSDDNCNLVVCEKSTKDGLAAKDGSTEQPPTAQQLDPPTKYLKLQQLPITVTEEDVLNEIDGDGSEVRRVTFYPDGEFKGAVLEFHNVDAAEATLKRVDCVLLCSTPVPVLRCSYKEYAQIKRKSGIGVGGRRFSGDGSGRHHHNHHQQHMSPSALSPALQQQPPQPPHMSMQPVIRSNCLYIYGLPTSVTNTDITQFFSDTSVLPDKIHIMLSKYGRPTGESYCEFGTAQQALVALAKDQFYMGPNIVYIQPISRSDMIQAITKPMQQHNHHQDISWNGGMRGTGGGVPRPQQHDNMTQPSVRHHHQGPSYGGGRPYMNNSTSGGRGGGNYTPRMRGPGPGPNTGPDGFGQPGCVVALDNVPYRADVQEIVDFFDGFELNSQNVIRRFNDFGKPTGEARVNLRNPQEAMRAVNVLQNMTIYNRPVRLTLL